MKNCNSSVNRRTHIACLIAALFLSAVTVASDRSDAIERIGQMTQQERQEIQNKRKRFEQLSVDEQKKVRTLHEQIEQHDSRQKLVTAMNRYNEWLKTLSASQRAELLEMPKEKRLEQIRILKGKSDRERLSRMISANLTKDDMSHVASWIQEFAKGHRPELLEAMPDKMRRGLRDKFDARIQFFLLHNAFRKNGKLPNPSDAEIESLVNGLSSEARKQ